MQSVDTAPVGHDAPRPTPPDPLHEFAALMGTSAWSGATWWEYAKARGFLIVTKDSDFQQQSFVHGHPPKVIWLRLGNRATARPRTSSGSCAPVRTTSMPSGVDERGSLLALS